MIRGVLGVLIHNVIAHPLIGIGQAIEQLGGWLHDHTDPGDAA